MTIDPANPLLLLLAAVGAMSSVVVFIWKDGERRVDQLLREKDGRIAWLEQQLADEKGESASWRQVAFSGTKIAEVAVTRRVVQETP